MESKLALQVRRRKVIDVAWVAIKRNARTSKSQDTRDEIAAFEANLTTNLRRISRELQQNNFVFPPARGIKIPKDKSDRASFRPLVVAKVESRIVQRAIHDVLVSVPAIQKFVHTPYSFGGIKKKKDDDLAAVPAAIKAILCASGRVVGLLFAPTYRSSSPAYQNLKSRRSLQRLSMTQNSSSYLRARLPSS